MIAISLLLYRRYTGAIHSRNISNGSAGSAMAVDSRLTWGPWHMPGRWGTMVNTFACVYLTTVIFFSLWPPKQPVTAENMNYAVLVTGAVIAFSVVYYCIWAKRVYTGPVIEAT